MSLPLPEIFLNRMQQQLGIELEEFTIALNTPPPISVRINPAKYSRPASLLKTGWTKYGYYLEERPSFTLDPLFHAGAYYVQEASSMFVEQALKAVLKSDNPLKILDLCAAPGGKSTHLLSLMDESSLLVSNEVINTRLGPLQENLAKWGHANVITTNLDPGAFERLSDYFDVVLIDAPCSGEGLFRKDPKAIQEWSVLSAANCVLRQNRIINDMIKCIKPGGYLIYSTCTYNPEENMQQVEKIINEHEFFPVTIPLEDSWGIDEQILNKAVGYQFFPHKTRGEGFFLSILQKTKSDNSKLKKYKSLPKYKGNKVNMESLLASASNFSLLEPFPNEVSFIPVALSESIEQLLGYIPIKKLGLRLGEVKGKDFVLHHELALSINRSNAIPSIELDKENALQFLRKNDFVFDSAQKGWHLVCYDGLGLGWVNITSGRANNKLPVNLRIRNL